MARSSLCGVALACFICGITSTLFSLNLLTGWSSYHFRRRAFLAIAGYQARTADTQLCLSQDNTTVISCELAAMTRIIQLRFTKDLAHHTYHSPDSIIPYSRHQMDLLWNTTFPSPTHLPIALTEDHAFRDTHHYRALWIVNRRAQRTNAALTTSELRTLKARLSATGVIVAIHGGALVMGSAGHLVPYLTHLSAMMGDLDLDAVPPILAFDYRRLRVNLLTCPL